MRAWRFSWAWMLVVFCGLTDSVSSSAQTPKLNENKADVINTISPSELTAILQQSGYKAEIGRSDNELRVRTGMSGHNVTIYFYSCKEEICRSITFNLRFSKDPMYNIELANKWNNEKRFAKSYIDDLGLYNLEWDVDLKGGVGKEFVKDCIERFDGTVASFDKFRP